ncbi:PREDICTED: non-structural maintenance of chromosomes element 1 homolog [Priapulus caudatus]|uniref:Non-structural maintenance of chromosomes element 1 homolog n=1 Tax=Priapulus caudatus TaxID=37621 RepID=A0ABM1E3K0_PRICU|nr:PREDICTED: non-structural maintenance of chromosomes element 1 homolog [Priapulus caudatus]
MTLQMNDTHRMFLQALMTRRIMQGKEVKKIYNYCHEACDVLTEDANLSQFVVAINSNIRLYNMEIKKGVNEVSGAQYYALVNLSDSPVTRLAADFTPLELELFKKMMDMIVYSDNGIISSIDAINLTSVLDKKMSKDAAESVVQRLAIDKWINVERGDVSLAVRGILELDQYLRETYGELLLTCNMCKQICLQTASSSSNLPASRIR